MAAELPARDNVAAYWGVAVILDGYDDWWLLMPDKGYTSKVELINGGKLKVRGHWLHPTHDYTAGDTTDRIFEKKGKDTVSVYSVIYEGIALRPLGGGKYEMPSASVVGVNGAFQWVNEQEAKAAAIKEEEQLLPPPPTPVVAEQAEVSEEVVAATPKETVPEVPTPLTISAEVPIDVDTTPPSEVLVIAEVEDEDEDEVQQTIPDAHTILVARDRKGGVVPAYWDGTLLIPLSESTVDGDVVMWKLGRNRRQFTLGPDSGTEVLEILGPCDPATQVDNTTYQLCVLGDTLVNTWIRPKRPLTLPDKVIADWLRTPDEPLAPFRSNQWIDQRVAQSLAAEEEVLACLI